MTSVASVGHCKRKPIMINTKPAYCGWRRRAYGPVVASVSALRAANSTRQPAAISQKPPMMNT